MAWNNWSLEYNKRLCIEKPSQKKYYKQKHHEFVERIVKELRDGFGVFIARHFLDRFQWVIHNPEFQPKLRLKIEIVDKLVKISPIDENGIPTSKLYKNLMATYRFKTKFLVVSQEKARAKLEKDRLKKEAEENKGD
jgi:hypothetical protein